MAIHALSTTVVLVFMMLGRVKFSGTVTLQTQTIAFYFEFGAVGLVAVRTHHAFAVHFTLLE
jgi:hypothetical protein